MSDEKEKILDDLKQIKEMIGEYSDSTIKAYIEEVEEDIKKYCS